MTRKIIVVPWIVSTELYEPFVRNFSFGVASCVRMSSARIPPNAKKRSDVQMYISPMRLWSTVVSSDVSRPRRQSARYGSTVSTFTAI